MDIFGDDIDSFLGQGELNENIREDDIDDNEENENGDDKDGEGTGESKKLEPKRRTARKPQLRLNVERLKSDRGIHTLEKYCSDLKFHGKGHERHDLDNLMKRLEHWAHRLYPNYRFDDFVTQVEKLGRKKEMQTHLHRYRHGMLEDFSNKNKADNELNENNEEDRSRIEGVEPIDELDEIIDQQLQNYTMFSSASKTPAHDRTFESIRSSVCATPRLRDQHPVEQSTPLAKPLVNPNVVNTPPPNKLTADQMARIAENRRLAQERLRQKRLEAAANATLNDTNNDNMEF